MTGRHLDTLASTLSDVGTMAETGETQGGRWHAQDVRRLAALVMVSERTVYRWYEAPERTNRGTAIRLEAAARQIGAQLPKKASVA